MILKPVNPKNISRRVLPGEIITSWVALGKYKDILLDISPEGIARVAINRPEKRNAFRPQTISELCHASVSYTHLTLTTKRIV